MLIASSLFFSFYTKLTNWGRYIGIHTTVQVYYATTFRQTVQHITTGLTETENLKQYTENTDWLTMAVSKWHEEVRKTIRSKLNISPVWFQPKLSGNAVRSFHVPASRTSYWIPDVSLFQIFHTGCHLNEHAAVSWNATWHTCLSLIPTGI